MERIWLRHYEPGVPFDIDTRKYDSLVDLLQQSIAAHRNRPAFHHLGRQLTYGQVDELSARFAAYLQFELGLAKGDRLAIMMPNVLQYPIAMYGAIKAGLTVTSINPLYTPSELAHQLRDSGARSIVILETFCRTLQQALETVPVENVIVTAVGDMLPFPKSALVNLLVRRVKKRVPAWRISNVIPFKAALARRPRETPRTVALGHQDVAFLQYTGGTSGIPKGVVLTHRNVLAAAMQIAAWGVNVARPGAEIAMLVLPLYHSAGLIQCIASMTYGTCNVLVPDPRDISQLIKELKRNRVTVMSAVNTLYGAMLRHPGIREVDFRNLRASISGAMAMQQTVADDWKSVTGCPMVEAYGLTEASGIAVANPLSTIDCKGRIGIPLPSIEVELRDDEGKPVGFDTPGELWIRGPNVMHGYWNRPDESAKVCDRRNFVATGDITIMDRDGFLKIVDRKKDVILVSGFNVFPAEIEDVLSRHPGILDVAAVGRSDPHSGEAVTIFVVARHSSLTEEAVITFARRHLTSYKVPSEVVLMPSLPKSPVGKTLRRILREQVGQASAHRHGHRRRAEARR